MGMAASSLRFAQLTARKNQVEFEGQQINQQRLVLSQKSSAIYNDMLTKQVPTAPDPSQFTKIVYKFNNGNGTSQILNLARKTSGAYNYNITYKKPATSTVLSRSKFQNVNFVKTIGSNGGYTANINGVARELTAVGEKGKRDAYEEKLAIYNKLKAIDDVRSSINASDKTSFSGNRLKEYAQSAGLNTNLFKSTTNGSTTTYSIDKNNELAVALFKAAGAKDTNNKAFGAQGFDYTNIVLDSTLTGTPKNVQALIGVISGGSLVDKDSGQATEISADNTNAIFEEIAKNLSGKSTAAEYKTSTLDPAFTAYQASCATPGIVNIAEGQALYSYQDDNGQTCYMYVPIDKVANDINNSYADEVTVYENATTYLDGQTETEQQDANVILSDEGQISKITFADGTVVTPEVVTEMDQDAYDAAMVEYEYKKDVYEKEMNDANAKVKVIQAQDQKLEVRLKQLDTEQKALSTEIDAVKSVRDKSIEGSFKTFG